MKPRSRAGAILAILSFWACARDRRPDSKQENDCGAVQGDWHGFLEIVGKGTDEADLHDRLELVLRLSQQPRVFSMERVGERAGWIEVKPGTFSIRCLGPSAFLGTIDTALDHDGRWYESWVMTATIIDSDRLLLHWVRMVNNADLPLTNRNSKFSYAGTGVLGRAQIGFGSPTSQSTTQK